MPRYFIEFINLQKPQDSNGHPNTIAVTIKLFHNSLPNTTNRISSLFFTTDPKQITYKKSKVTRVIAPEYLIQFGDPVRRNRNKKNGIDDLIDKIEIAKMHNDKFAKHINGRSGLVCIASKPDDIVQSIQLCVLFVPWGQYPELDGYVVVGECKEWNLLKKWMSNIEVDSDTLEIPTEDGVWISRCGRLQEKGDSKEREISSTNRNIKPSGKIKAVDLLFKKQRLK